MFTRRDVQIGYISADRCAWIGSKIDRGYDVECAVEAITGGVNGGWLGIAIRIRISGGELAPPVFSRAA